MSRGAAERLRQLAKPRHVEIEETYEANVGRRFVWLNVTHGRPGKIYFEKRDVAIFMVVGDKLFWQGFLLSLPEAARLVRDIDEALQVYYAARSIVHEKVAEAFLPGEADKLHFQDYTHREDPLAADPNPRTTHFKRDWLVWLGYTSSIIFTVRLTFSLSASKEGKEDMWLYLASAVLLTIERGRALSQEDASLLEQLLRDLAEIFGAGELAKAAESGWPHMVGRLLRESLEAELWSRKTRYRADDYNWDVLIVRRY